MLISVLATAEETGRVRSVIVVLRDGDGVAGKSAVIPEFTGLKELKRVFPSVAPKKDATVALQASPAAGRLDRMYVAEVEPEKLAAVLHELNRSPLVEYAEPNWPVELCALPNDSLFASEQWSLSNTGQTYHTSSGALTNGLQGADINWLASWNSGAFPTNEILVGVVDSGVDYTHSELAGRIWTNPGEIPDNGQDDDQNGYIDDMHGIDLAESDSDPMDDNGHGTHVAGTIAAQANNDYGMAGICPSARILAARMFDASGSGSSLDGIRGIRYAADMGAQLINNSWGGSGYSQALQDAINYATEQGALVLAAAGNNGSGFPFYPAAYENVLCVAASDSADRRAWFSNYGTHVDVSAPGVDILSLLSSAAVPPGAEVGGEFTVLSGTSMACPTACGAAALLRIKRPGFLPWVYGQVMERSCTTNYYTITDNSNYTGLLGAGRLDVQQALTYTQRTAFLSSKVELRSAFGRMFLVPGETAPMTVKAASWLDTMTGLAVRATAMTTGITLNASGYMIGTLASGVSTTLPAGVFSVSVRTNAAWNSVQKIRMELLSGTNVLDTHTNFFQIYGGKVSDVVLTDLEHDGRMDVVGTAGSTVSVFDDSGTLRWFADMGNNQVIQGGPAVGDVDGDGFDEIVVTHEFTVLILVGARYVTVIEHDGTVNTNRWPMEVSDPFGSEVFLGINPPALADMDGNGSSDISLTGAYNGRARYLFLTGGGEEIGRYASAVRTNNFGVSLPALGRLSVTGPVAAVTVERSSSGGASVSFLTAVLPDGTERFSVPVAAGSNNLFGSTVCAPVLADLDFDGQTEFLAVGLADSTMWMVALEQNGEMLPGFPVHLSGDNDTEQPVVADIDGDGDLEIFVYSRAGSEIQGYDHLGNRLPDFPVQDVRLPGGLFANGYHISVANVDGDGAPELIYAGVYTSDAAGNYSFDVVARDFDGLLIPGFPRRLSGQDGGDLPVYRLLAGPSSGNEFGTNGYLYATTGAGLHVIDTGCPFQPGQQHWPQRAKDAARTYAYELPAGALRGNLITADRRGVNTLDVRFDSFCSAVSTSAVYYRWDFNHDGVIDAEGWELSAVTNHYGAPGAYTVSLTLSNAAGEVFTVTHDALINVYADLAADFAWSPSGTLTAPIRVDFTDQTANGPQFWNWDFGDGSVSGLQNPKHLYTNTGVYTVMLTVSNDFGTGGASADTEVKTGIITIGSVQTGATSHYVRPGGLHRWPFKNWAEAATNIAEAVAAAAPGEQVVVTDGLYAVSSPIYVSNAVAVRSVNGPLVTIVDGGRQTGAFDLRGQAVLQGFTVQRCGGGKSAVELYDGSAGRDLIVRDSKETDIFNGGAAYISDSFLYDSLIESNESYLSAGMFVVNGLVSNCVIRGNRAVTRGGGAMVSSSGKLYNCLITHNTAATSAVELTTGGHLENCTVASNTVTGSSGGAVTFDSYSLEDASRVVNTIVHGNSGSNWYFMNKAQPRRAKILNSCYSPAMTNLAEGQTVNIVTAAPAFRGGGDFRLQSNSSCINAGYNYPEYTHIDRRILIDLGHESYPVAMPGWNDVTSPAAGLKITDLVNTNGAATGVSLTFLNAFATNQYTDGFTGGPYPDDAQRDGFIATNSLIDDYRPYIRLDGLRTDRVYKVTFFASRSSSANTRYRIGSERTETLAAISNVSRTVSLPNLIATNGAMTIDIFYWGGSAAVLGVLDIEEALWQYETVLSNQTDLAGAPRLIGPAADIGAYEWQTNYAPAVSLTVSPVTGAAPLTVSAAAAATDPEGQGMIWNWRFGDGSSSSGISNITHIYTEPGFYELAAIVTDLGGAAATAKTGIAVMPAVPPPPGAFTGTVLSAGSIGLAWSPVPSAAGYMLERRMVTNATVVVVDNPSAVFDGTWNIASSAGSVGGSYRWCDPQGTIDFIAEYLPDLPEEGWYEIFEWHPAHASGQLGVPHVIHHLGGRRTVFQDQTSVTAGRWNSLGVYRLQQGSFVEIFPYGLGARAMADALKFVRVEEWLPLAAPGAGVTNWTDSGLHDDRLYSYRAAASNSSGCSLWTETAVFLPPTNARPVAVVHSVAPSGGTPDLPVAVSGSGTDSDGVITNYIWNFGDGYAGSVQKGANLTNASFVYRVIGQYTITLTVQDDRGYCSTNPAAAAVTVYGLGPNAPTGLTAAAHEPDYIEVRWTDCAFNEERQIVQRQTDGGAFSNLATTGESTELLTDSGVSFGHFYGYRVRAENQYGTSDWSNVGTVLFGSGPNYELPFSETFDGAGMASTPGALNGQHGWASGTNALVQSGAGQSGNGLRIQSDEASHAFVNGTNHVRIRWWAKPVAGITPTSGLSGASAVIWVNTNGNVAVFSNSTAVVLPVAVSSNVWNEFEVEVAYASNTWSLAVNGTNAAENLGLYSAQSAFSGIRLISPIGQISLIDDLNISNVTAQFAGLEAWLIAHYGTTNVNVNAVCSNGINTVLEAYIAGLNPLDPLDHFTLANARNVLNWDAVSGRVYTIYWTSNLLNGFQPVETDYSGGVFTDTVHGTEPKGFYKIEVRLAP